MLENLNLNRWLLRDANDGTGEGGNGVSDPVDNGNPPASNPPVGDNPPGTEAPPTIDLATLFTPEEVTAKQEAIDTAKAEEERRGKLTDDERTAEDKQKEEDAKANAVPEEYKFKVPEGMVLDENLMNAVTPFFKEKGLTQAQADEYVKLYAETIHPAIYKQQSDRWGEVVEGWKKEVMANKEIKIDDKGENSDGVRVINTLLNEAERKALYDSPAWQYGMGNLPGLNLLFARVAPLLREDTIEGKGGQAKPDLAHRMFPNLP